MMSEPADGESPEPLGESSNDENLESALVQLENVGGSFLKSDFLSRYSKVPPEVAARLVSIAESEILFRRELEERSARAARNDRRVGLAMAFAILVLTVLSALVLLNKGEDHWFIILNTVPAAVALTSATSAFFLRRKKARSARPSGETNAD